MTRARLLTKPLPFHRIPFGWAVEQDPPLLRSNPARDVRRIKYATKGFHTWTPDEVAQFEAHYPIGSKGRLALALLLFTGTRRQDMVTLGRQHIKDRWLKFTPRKMRHKRPEPVEKPWLPILSDIVAESPCGAMTFLQTQYGRPFMAKGFGNWFHDRCTGAMPACRNALPTGSARPGDPSPTFPTGVVPLGATG
jgi:integrase